MQSGTHYLIDGNTGGLKRLTINVQDLVTEQRLIDQLSSNRVVEVRNIFKVGGAPCHLKRSKDGTYVTMEVPYIELMANFKAMPDGIMVPSFAPRGKTGELELKPRWTPPEGCRLRFMVWISNDEPSILECCFAAFDNDGRAFLTELPNIYEDGKVCMGEYRKNHPDLQSCVTAAAGQFFGSHWNSDLAPDMAKCAAMFSFKAEGTTLTPVPVVGDWRTYCEKVSNSQIEMFTV